MGLLNWPEIVNVIVAILIAGLIAWVADRIWNARGRKLPG